MEYYLLASMPFFVCATFTAIMLLDLVQNPTPARRALTIFMATAAMLYLCHCVYFCHETRLIPVTDTIYSFCNPLVYPLYYLYIKRLTGARFGFWGVGGIAMTLAPGICCGVAVGILYALMEPTETVSFIEEYLYNNHMQTEGLMGWQLLAHMAVKVVYGLQLIPILWLGFKRINAYDQELERYYSSPEERRLTWVKLMLLIFTGTSIVGFVSSLVGRYRFTNDETLLALPSTLFTMLLFTVGYVGLKQKEVDLNQAEEKTTIEPATERVKQLPMAATEEVQDSLTLRQRIDQLMSKEQLYLNPQLKLTDLVQRLGSNRNYVYQAINIEMSMPFAEYVNRMRIEYAEQLMLSQPQMPLTEVATRAGFASTTSFYRNFKIFRGCSPKSFKMASSSGDSTEKAKG